MWSKTRCALGLQFQSQLVLAALGEDFCWTGFLGLDLIHTELSESYTKRKKERKKNLPWISGIVAIITLKAVTIQLQGSHLFRRPTMCQADRGSVCWPVGQALFYLFVVQMQKQRQKKPSVFIVVKFIFHIKLSSHTHSNSYDQWRLSFSLQAYEILLSGFAYLKTKKQTFTC